MAVELVQADDGDLTVARNLSRFYIYDMSEWSGELRETCERDPQWGPMNTIRFDCVQGP